MKERKVGRWLWLMLGLFLLFLRIPSSFAEAKNSQNGKKKLLDSFVAVDGILADGFTQTRKIQISKPEKYTEMTGVLTFRGGPVRNNASVGTVAVEKEELKVMRGFRTSRLDAFTGYGFGSQAVLVKWFKNVREMMNIYDKYRNGNAMKEVIVPSNDGKIYFFDLNAMELSRDPIAIGVPMSVTASINPYGFPLLYVGQSAETVADYTVNTGLRVFSLLDQKRLFFETSLNTISHSDRNEVFSSPVVETGSDTVIYTNANGMLYMLPMNTGFDMEAQTVAVNPECIAYGYATESRWKDPSLVANTSVYSRYAYLADMSGILQCVDMISLKCLWSINLSDSILAAMPLEREGKSLYLYTGTAVNKTQRSRGITLYKLDASDGNVIWEYTTPYPAKYESKPAESGIYAGLMGSPILGEGDIEDLIIFNVNRLAVNGEKNSAVLYALSKESGEVVWETELGAESVSSPTALYTEEGRCYIVVGDEDGFLHLIDGGYGAILDSVFLGSAVQASPAAYGNRIVVGTTGGVLYFIDLQ